MSDEAALYCWTCARLDGGQPLGARGGLERTQLTICSALASGVTAST